MTQKEDLHLQVHNITELSNVLTLLMSDKSVCDSGITCELFFRYVEAVRHHLQNTESELFSRLLVNSNEQQSKVLERFMDGSHEIKKIFAEYTKKWCKNNQLRIGDHASFQDETAEMLNLVLRRLQDETENLYPLIPFNKPQFNQTHTHNIA